MGKDVQKDANLTDAMREMVPDNGWKEVFAYGKKRVDAGGVEGGFYGVSVVCGQFAAAEGYEVEREGGRQERRHQRGHEAQGREAVQHEVDVRQGGHCGLGEVQGPLLQRQHGGGSGDDGAVHED